MPDQPIYRPVHKAMHRPLTVCGVDRRLFFLALLMGAATFNLFYSFWSASLSHRREAGGATTLGSTSDSTCRWCGGEDRAHPA